MPPSIRDGGAHCMRAKDAPPAACSSKSPHDLVSPPDTPVPVPSARRPARRVLAPGIGRAETATTQATKITFVLVNDIYLMGDKAMPDGQRRGGFARLAAVVKAEREPGGHVIFAHAGDTLSPSLMSGLDRGAHIITLTNMIPPDIFAPGNHEFDFGKEIFFKRMAEAKFPLYAANLRAADGKPLPNFQDRSIVTFDGVRIGLTGATFDDTPRTSSPGDLQFLPTVSSTVEQAELLRKEGADFVVAVMHADRKQDYELFATHAIDLILTGHDHDLFINYDERNAMVEFELRRALRDRDRRDHFGQGAGRQARRDVVAAVPRDRHRQRDAGPRGRGGGRQIRGGALARAGRAARHHRGRARQPQRHRAHARGRDRQPDRRRHARIDQDRRRDHERRRHPRQARSIRLAQRSPGATCWRNCRSTIAW